MPLGWPCKGWCREVVTSSSSHACLGITIVMLHFAWVPSWARSANFWMTVRVMQLTLLFANRPYSLVRWPSLLHQEQLLVCPCYCMLYLWWTIPQNWNSSIIQRYIILCNCGIIRYHVTYFLLAESLCQTEINSRLSASSSNNSLQRSNNLQKCIRTL